jgi:GTP pyrophosphokinase
MYEPERRIAVEWSAKEPRLAGSLPSYPVKLTITSDDRAGILKQVTAVIGDADTNIRHIEAGSAEDHNQNALIDLVLDITDVTHLNRIITGLRKIPGVHEVQRVQKL